MKSRLSFRTEYGLYCRPSCQMQSRTKLISVLDTDWPVNQSDTATQQSHLGGMTAFSLAIVKLDTFSEFPEVWKNFSLSFQNCQPCLFMSMFIYPTAIPPPSVLLW